MSHCHSGDPGASFFDVNDPLLRHLRWQCARCGAARGVTAHDVRTTDGPFTLYRCRSCAAVVDRSTPGGTVVLTTLGPETRN